LSIIKVTTKLFQVQVTSFKIVLSIALTADPNIVAYQTLPVSKAVFQFNPQSLRFISVDIENCFMTSPGIFYRSAKINTWFDLLSNSLNCELAIQFIAIGPQDHRLQLREYEGAPMEKMKQ